MGVFGTGLKIPFLFDAVSFKTDKTSLDIRPLVQGNGINPLNLSVTRAEANLKLKVEGEYNYQNWYLMIKPAAHYELADKLFCVEIEDPTFLKKYDSGQIDFGLNSKFACLNNLFAITPEFHSQDKQIMLSLPYEVAYTFYNKQNISVGLSVGINSNYSLGRSDFSLEQCLGQYLISTLRFSCNNLNLTATVKNNLKPQPGSEEVAEEDVLETKLPLNPGTSIATYVKKEIKTSGKESITAGLNLSGVF